MENFDGFSRRAATGSALLATAINFRSTVRAFGVRLHADPQAEIAALVAKRDDPARSRLQRAFAASIIRRLGEGA